MSKVSVIVPVYGVEKYIERCARSLFEQTLDDMQFIFIDDCTKDDSISILEEVIEDYPERKSQIIIYKLSNNMGLHEVRKIGISLANGDYIAHCDSDDWVDVNMYKLMYEKAINDSLDIVQCQYYKSDGNSHVAFSYEGRNMNILERKDDIMSNILMAKGWNCIWNKITRKEIYSEFINYPKSYMFEDLVLSLQLIFYSSRIGEINLPLYYYYYNPNSICHQDNPISYINRSLSAKKNIDIILFFVKENKLDLKFKEELLYSKYMVKLLMVKGLKTLKDYMYWENIYPDVDNQLVKSKTIPFKGKLIFLLIKLKLYHILIKFKKQIH